MYSVVIPTFNRVRYLPLTVESLMAQETDSSYEVIIVDNNSSDETGAVGRAFEQRYPGKLHYAFEPRQGLSIARNRGVAAASGDIIVFVDDDVVAEPTWLSAIAGTYRIHPDAWCVGGKIVFGPQAVTPPWFDPASKILTTYLSCLDMGGDIVKLDYPSVVWGANFSVRRDAFSNVGFFDPRFGWIGMDHRQGSGPRLAGEEGELCLRIYRAGGSIYYCGRAVVTHLIPASRMTKRYFRQRAYWGGRTDALLFPGHSDQVLWRLAAGLVSNIAKDWLWMLASYGTSNVRRAFEHELAGWFWWGKLQQTRALSKHNRKIGCVSQG